MTENRLTRKNRDRKFKQTVGLFVLISMTLVLGTLWLGNASINPFDTRYLLYIELDHAEGLKPETPVTLAGLLVGRVSNIQFAERNKIRVTVSLLTKHQDKVRKDSYINLVKPMLGGASLDISLGSPDRPVLKDGASILLKKDTSIADLIAQMPSKLVYVETILANVATLSGQLIDPEETLQKSLASVEHSLENMLKLSDQLTKKDEKLQQTLANLERLSGEAAKLMAVVHTTMPSMLGDLNKTANKSIHQVEGLLTELQGTVHAIQPVLGQVNTMLGATTKIAEDVAKITGQLGKASPKIPVLLNQGQEMMGEASVLLRSVNNSFLFRSDAAADAKNSRLVHTPRDLPMTFPTTP